VYSCYSLSYIANNFSSSNVEVFTFAKLKNNSAKTAYEPS